MDVASARALRRHQPSSDAECSSSSEQSPVTSPADRAKGAPVVLLADSPVPDDEFAGKAHRRIADAIAEIVESEPGGNAIGLEGDWGSGKSTIVSLVCRRLSTVPSSTHAFVFDAWAHQGDPLRRTFLEKLVQDLRSRDWLTKSDASQFDSRLSGRSSRVRTSSSSRLSTEGATVSVALLLVPLGAALLGNTFSEFHRPALYVGLGILLLPLVVVIAFALLSLLGRLAVRRNSGSGWGSTLAKINPFSFFAREQNTDTSTDAIEHGEPTSVEFEGMFLDVLHAALDAPDRRLLLVLDNLDRVAESDAQVVLATMQTFTGSSGAGQAEVFDRVWTLIPFDSQGLRRLWDPDIKENGPNSSPGPTSAAFVDKLFQVRFETPPMVLSDWRSYLARLLREALPAVSEPDLKAIVRLRAVYPAAVPNRTIAFEPPTPRQLKQFTNQLGALLRQRDDVAAVHAAYYVLLRRDGFNVAAELASGTLPHDRLAHVLQKRTVVDLAALYFGTAADLAQQLLIGSALERSFSTMDEKPLREVIDAPGFVEALDAVDWQGRAGDGAIELTRAVVVLQDAGALDKTEVIDWMVEALLPIAEAVDPWAVSGRETGEGLGRLMVTLTWDRDHELPRRWLSRLQPAAREADETGAQHIAGLAALADELEYWGLVENSDLRLPVSIPSDRLAVTLANFRPGSPEPRVCALLKLDLEPAAVAKAIAQSAATDQHDSAIRALEVLLAREDQLDLGVLATVALEWLRNQDAPHPGPLEALLRCVEVGAAHPDGASALRAAANDGTLLQAFFVAIANNWWTAAALTSLLQLRMQPTDGPGPQLRSSAQGAQLLNQILTNPSSLPELMAAQTEALKDNEADPVSLVLAVSSEPSYRPWADVQLAAVVGGSCADVSAEALLSNWPTLRAVLGEEQFVGLTGQLIRDTDKRQSLTANLVAPAVATAAIRSLQLEPPAGRPSEVWTWGRRTVREAAESSWRSALANEAGGSLLELALIVETEGKGPRDTPELGTALRSHFESLADGQPVWHPDGDTMENLTGLLSDTSLRTLAIEACAILTGRDGPVGRYLLPTYGQVLRGQQAFRSHSRLPSLIERFVASDDADSLRWIVETAETHDDTLSGLGRQDEINSLIARVDTKIAESIGQVPEDLQRLRDLLP
jgi:hypothetical protein